MQRDNIEYKIINTDDENYPYNVQKICSVDGNTYYCGVGKFCKNISEVDRYINDNISIQDD